MVENTRLKDLAVEMKKLAEMMEASKSMLEFTQLENKIRFEKIESAMDIVFKRDSSMSSGAVKLNEPFQVRNVKLDFPRFDGSEVLQWIFKAKQFFDYYLTPYEQWLTIIAIHLDKDLVPWFQMQQKINPFNSWITFTPALELKYGPSPYECPISDLFKMIQVVQSMTIIFNLLLWPIVYKVSLLMLYLIVLWEDLNWTLNRKSLHNHPLLYQGLFPWPNFLKKNIIQNLKLTNQPIFLKHNSQTQPKQTTYTTNQSLKSTSLLPLLSSPP